MSGEPYPATSAALDGDAIHPVLRKWPGMVHQTIEDEEFTTCTSVVYRARARPASLGLSLL